MMDLDKVAGALARIGMLETTPGMWLDESKIANSLRYYGYSWERRERSSRCPSWPPVNLCILENLVCEGLLERRDLLGVPQLRRTLKGGYTAGPHSEGTTSAFDRRPLSLPIFECLALRYRYFPNPKMPDPTAASPSRS
jgi:hypothetical protein